MKRELLEIVDKNDIVVGKDTRENIHNKGLLHREVHVWFVTPSGELIFQHRAKNKDTYPDTLDATVGGHVEPGASYENTAIKETKEETGIKMVKSDLHLVKKIRQRSEDASTGKINNAFKVQYVYIYKGKISDLNVEKGKALGFEAWYVDKIINLDETKKKKFIPGIFTLKFIQLFREIKKFI